MANGKARDEEKNVVEQSKRFGWTKWTEVMHCNRIVFAQKWRQCDVSNSNKQHHEQWNDSLRAKNNKKKKRKQNRHNSTKKRTEKAFAKSRKREFSERLTAMLFKFNTVQHSHTFASRKKNWVFSIVSCSFLSPLRFRLSNFLFLFVVIICSDRRRSLVFLAYALETNRTCGANFSTSRQMYPVVQRRTLATGIGNVVISSKSMCCIAIASFAVDSIHG